MASATLLRFLKQAGPVNDLLATEIADRFTPLSMSKNEFFLKENKVADRYFFLENGFMRAFAIDTNGEEVTTNFFAPDNVVFEVNSFFNRVPSQENIQCLIDCEGWVLSFAALNDLFHAIPAFRELGRSVLVKNFALLKTRMLSMITQSADQRYLHLIESQPQVFQFAPLKYIASYLGITDTSLSRIRKEFSQK